MYRRQGSSGALQGVLSGPYTGGERRLDAAKLPSATRRRLADVLAARAEPTPIAYVRPERAGARFPASGALVAGLVAIATLTAIGFGDVRSDVALGAPWMAGGFVAASCLAAAGLLVLLRRRASLGGAELRPGRYLLPLDVVFVPSPDPAGRQVITVRPLGDARDATLRGDRRREIVVLFEGGDEASFPARGDGSAALRQMEHAQRLLEDLTYKRDLDRAVANDPLFDVRADGSWGDLAPGEDGALPALARSWSQGPVGTVVAALLATIAGLGAFAARNRLSDRAMFLRASREGTVDALDRYLGVGSAYRGEAERARLILLARARAHEPSAPAEPPARPESELTPDEARARRGTAEACVEALTAHGSSAHPGTAAIMAGLVARARRTGDPSLAFVFARDVEAAPPGAPDLAPNLDARQRTTAWAFERVLSEICPAGLVRFDPRAEDVATGLELRYSVRWSGRWSLRWACVASPDAPCPETRDVHPVTFAFDVTLRGLGGEVERFHLEMPPPGAPSTEVRARSLFTIAGAPLPPGVYDARVYDAMTARAFDRLYDELWGLFFDGDPRVPLREGEAP